MYRWPCVPKGCRPAGDRTPLITNSVARRRRAEFKNRLHRWPCVPKGCRPAGDRTPLITNWVARSGLGKQRAPVSLVARGGAGRRAVDPHSLQFRLPETPWAGFGKLNSPVHMLVLGFRPAGDRPHPSQLGWPDGRGSFRTIESTGILGCPGGTGLRVTDIQ